MSEITNKIHNAIAEISAYKFAVEQVAKVDVREELRKMAIDDTPIRKIQFGIEAEGVDPRPRVMMILVVNPDVVEVVNQAVHVVAEAVTEHAGTLACPDHKPDQAKS